MHQAIECLVAGINNENAFLFRAAEINGFGQLKIDYKKILFNSMLRLAFIIKCYRNYNNGEEKCDEKS